MPCFELEFACIIPRSRAEEEPLEPPFVIYKGTDYKKTIRFHCQSWQPIKSRLKRFWNWLGFVWFHSRSRKCRKLCFIFVLSIVLLLFTIFCVLLPLIFKWVPEFQRKIIFSPVVASHDSFNNPIELHKSYDSKTFVKPYNFYVKTSGAPNAVLGVWSLAQYGQRESSRYQYRQSVSGSDNYLLFFHDSYGNRGSYTFDYSKLLNFFNVIVFDYRAYGDSYVDNLNESGLVEDSVAVYKWLRSYTNGSIFLWGDNLGAAVAAHTAAVLSHQNASVCGVLLENPFTTMGEQLAYSWFVATINWYLPWYQWTIADPLEGSDLTFNTSKYINEIKYPIAFLEWSLYRARQFNVDIIYNQYSFYPSKVTSFIIEYYYYKTDGDFGSSTEDYLRSFIGAGVSYCSSNGKHSFDSQVMTNNSLSENQV